MTMKQLANQLYHRARAAETTVDILQARLNVMRGVAILGWTAFILHVWGV